MFPKAKVSRLVLVPLFFFVVCFQRADGSSEGIELLRKRLIDELSTTAPQEESSTSIAQVEPSSTTPLSEPLKTTSQSKPPTGLVEGAPTTTIPHVMWFTHKENMLETKQPRHLYDNVLFTIQEYRNAWGEPDAPVYFLDDPKCREIVEEAYPQLVPSFDKEPKGAFRGDICRTAALYLYGGYYFDVDMRVIEPCVASEGEVFISPVSPNEYFFNSFIASVPKHVMLARTLGAMANMYRNGRLPGFLGPASMKAAMFMLPEKDQKGMRLIAESELGEVEYPEVQRQDGWGTCLFAVHDPQIGKPYFWSRIPGAGACVKLQGLPRRLWMTYEDNILHTLEPKNYYDNIKRTQNVYTEAWKGQRSLVKDFFLDGQKCLKEVSKAEPKLVPFYQSETSQHIKSTICKVAVLTRFGGHFFDVEWEAVEPFLSTDDTVTFASALSCGSGCLSPSFMASVPRHPILKQALQEILNFYENDDRNPMMGEIALANAYYKLPEEERRNALLLEEVTLSSNDHPELQRQANGENCNYAVADPASEQIYFFNRFDGHPGCEGATSVAASS